MALPTIQLKGQTYVLLEREEYERLTTLAKAAELPKPDASGTVPAVEYVRASLAQDHSGSRGGRP